MGRILKLDRSGHSVVAKWDKSAGVEEAYSQFNQLQASHYTLYDISTPIGRVLTRFDPTATEILATPRLVGG